jgi:release factor glutamine methyltransferase
LTGHSRPQTADALFRAVRQQLSAADCATPELDASLIIEHVGGISPLDRLSDPGRELAGETLRKIEDSVARRIGGEPVHRITGERGFYGLSLELNDATLVPRPDTEALVELVLPFIREKIVQEGGCSILDIGTGSGAIALALLANAAGATATGSDVSDEALETARLNAERNGLSGRFETVRSDWFSEISGSYDVIVSNPPYIRTEEIGDLASEVRDHEPRIALDGGPDGLRAYRNIAAGADRHLSRNGAIALEIGYDQKTDVTALFERAGYRKLAENQDLSGHDRAIFFVK